MARTPSSDRPYLTAEGRRALEARIHDRERTVEALRAVVDEPDRPLDAVEEYQRAARELDDLRTLVDGAGMVEDIPDDPTVVELGDVVTISLDDEREETYIVVHAAEAAVEDQRISVDSPLGRALLGRNVGDRVDVAVPAGSYRCTITSATRRASGST